MQFNAFQYGYGTSSFLAQLGGLGFLFVLIMVWSAVWKGLALWHSARRGQPWWFVIMMFINTVGILELVYLFGVAKLKWDHLFTKDSGTPPQNPPTVS